MRHVLVIVAISVLACSCGKEREGKGGSSSKSSGSATNPSKNPASTVLDAAVPPPPTPMDKMLAASTLCEAILATKPLMTDEQNRKSEGASFLAIWMASNTVTWTEILMTGKSTYELVMKDPDDERGRRICAEDVSIIEIRTEKTPWGKVYHGGLSLDRGASKVMRFTAVRSTEGLVEGKRATFCGIVIGTQSYGNTGGGTTHAVYAVGMFESKENRAQPSCTDVCAMVGKCRQDLAEEKCRESCKKDGVPPVVYACAARVKCPVFSNCFDSNQRSQDEFRRWMESQKAAGKGNDAVKEHLSRNGICGFTTPAKPPGPGRSGPR